MRRPRKPVPPNTVTVRSVVATMIKFANLCGIEQRPPDAAGRPPLAIDSLLVRPAECATYNSAGSGISAMDEAGSWAPNCDATIRGMGTCVPCFVSPVAQNRLLQRVGARMQTVSA